ncbi:MAG: elongation factor G [Rhodothalassiaceae bacterium]|nr:MAG: elongation factor G [Rhodothalassiaceae bacterium]
MASAHGTRVAAVIGPGGVGKTTLAEALARLEDPHVKREESGPLGIYAFSHLGDPWVLLDAPGLVDLAQHALDALQFADVALIVAPPDPNAAVLVAPAIRMVEDAHIPAVLFINRITEAEDRLSDLVAALQHFSKRPLLLRQIPVREGDRVVGAVDLISERAWRYRPGQPAQLVEVPEDLKPAEEQAREELLETLADFDDFLLEQLIEDQAPPSDALYALCARVLKEDRALPVLFGAAGEGVGLRRLMKALRHETPEAAESRAQRWHEEAVLGVVHAHQERHLGKVLVVRALKGSIATGKEIAGAKIGQITAIDGAGVVPALEEGQVGRLVKTDAFLAGAAYGPGGPVELRRPVPVLPPLARVTIAARHAKDEVRLGEALARLAGDDRSLKVVHDEESGALILEGQGDLHFRRVAEILEKDFGIEVDLGVAQPSYRETIAREVDKHYRHKKQTGGAGQFADIKFRLKPAPRGSGFQFEETIHGGAIPRQFIPAVEAGMQEGLKQGPLGFPVVDVAVTLYDGQHHSVDSSDMAFKIAGMMGVREAVKEAGSVLLEPIYAVAFEIPDAFSGALNPRISQLHGQIQGFARDPDHEGWEILKAELPGRALPALVGEVRSATQGTGRFTTRFLRYQEVYGRDAETILAETAHA